VLCASFANRHTTNTPRCCVESRTNKLSMCVTALSPSRYKITLFDYYSLVHLHRYRITLDTIMGAPKKLEDIRQRAHALASLLSLDTTTVRLMDGHGRLVLAFFEAVIEMYGAARLNSLTIILVDLVPAVTAFHQSFFAMKCNNVISITCNIFDLPSHPTFLTYYNFCGISKSLDQLKELLGRQLAPLMISFSRVRRAASKDYHRQLSLNVHQTMILTELPSNRKDFKTLLLNPRISCECVNGDVRTHPFESLRLTPKKAYSWIPYIALLPNNK